MEHVVRPSAVSVGVLEGDVQGSLDVRAAGRPARDRHAAEQPNPGSAARPPRDATLVRSASSQLPLERIDLLIIERVGNSLCPSGVSVGSRTRGVMVSSRERGRGQAVEATR